MSAANDVSAM